MARTYGTLSLADLPGSQIYVLKNAATSQRLDAAMSEMQLHSKDKQPTFGPFIHAQV